MLRSSSVHDPHWAFSASPLPGHGVFPQFSSTSSALLKMKPVCARGSRNTLSAEKLEGCVVFRQNQTRSQCIRVMWFPPFISGGRSCGFYGIRDQFRSPTGAIFTEPKKTGAGEHTCLHTPRVMHMSIGLSSLQPIFSLYIFSQNCTGRQKSLCNTRNGDVHAQRSQVVCSKTHSRARIHYFFGVHELCLSPRLESSLHEVCNFALLVHGCNLGN